MLQAEWQLALQLSAYCGESIWELATESKKARCISFPLCLLNLQPVNVSLMLVAILTFVLVAEWLSGMTIGMVVLMWFA